MSGYTQDERRIKINTPLGKDKLLLTAFSGHEEMSRLFNYHLDFLSEDDAIKPADIVGQNVTFWTAPDGGESRYWNGHISRFYAGSVQRDGLRNYRAEVVPWTWFLTRTADCRIFQEMTVKDIIEQIFNDLGFTDFDTSQIKGQHPTWEYCVQYRETDFNFVSRLMEKHGIFYFFKHEDGVHTMFIGDHKGAYQNCVEKDCEYSEGSLIPNHVKSWERRYEFRPGKYAQTDYNFLKPAGTNKTPSTILMTEENTIADVAKAKEFEIYDYPGEYAEKADGKTETKFRMEEEETPYDIAVGTSNCCTFSPGHKFNLKKHSGSEDGGYAITSIQHSATEPNYNNEAAPPADYYLNSFTVIPDKVTFRAARTTPKPVIQGSQTAVVTGPPGEEIWPDEHGRIKVQFFWDREGVRDENTTCWIRCQQISAGKGWGTMFIPRIGQEVVVTFLEGDPDRPLCTGVVYNAEQVPAYTLPDEKTKSYVKTNSSPDGDGYNEIRFEDKKDKEQIFVHAQKNMDVRVLNNSMERVIANRHLVTGWEKDGEKGGDQSEMVYRDQHLTVHRDQMEHIGANFQLKVGGIDEGEGNVDVAIDGDKKQTIGGNTHLHIEGDHNQKTDGTESLSVGGDLHQKASNIAVEGAEEIHLKAGMKVIVEAGIQITLKVGGNFVDIGPAGVTIVGTMVKINSGGAAGSGSGCSPTAPEDAAEAAPSEPAIADDSKTGQKSAPDSLS